MAGRISQAEIHGSPCAVRRWRGTVFAGWGPEAAHICLSPDALWGGAIRVYADASTLNHKGMAHHEALHGNRPPGIKNR
jgi:hypothetical protein